MASKCQQLPSGSSSFSLELMTIREFCVAARISYRQFFRLRAADEGPKVTWLGGKRMVTQEEAQNWIYSRTEA